MRLRVLYVTDLSYQAAGRRYCDEDIELATDLRRHFDLALCHPLDAASLMDGFDVVVCRNTGPVIHYQQSFEDFRSRAREAGTKVFTELTGQADQRGKQYLIDLFAAGFPVISTIDDLASIDRLPEVPEYVVKPKLGADSVGLRFVGADELAAVRLDGVLVQPRIDFTYEVSFYFVDRSFQYALYAPEPSSRWRLERYEPTDDDLRFAQRFVDWNTIDHGIQRVDACRTATGDLLLVEIEDLNPYLSLDAVPTAVRTSFVDAVVASITELAASR